MGRGIEWAREAGILMWHPSCLSSAPTLILTWSKMAMQKSRAILTVPVALLIAGCRPPADAEYGSSAAVRQLGPELERQIRTALEEYAGSPAQPRATGAILPATLKRGREIYAARCEQCHGVTGDGEGPQAAFMYPRPRDYRKGVFKFTSTPYGSKPRKADLLRTIERGVPGTSMPSFRLLPRADREAVTEYVVSLTHRGELEQLLASEAEFEESIDAELVTGLVADIDRDWHEAEFAAVSPLTPLPELTVEHVKSGREAFLTKGCSKCHGEDGRGHTRENVGTDTWGFPIRAADLTSGLLHGGPEPLDIYRRIISGINGTPMPGFRSSLESEPETIWNLVAYVLYVSGRRRAGEIPDAGSLRPYSDPGSAVAETAPAENP